MFPPAAYAMVWLHIVVEWNRWCGEGHSQSCNFMLKLEFRVMLSAISHWLRLVILCEGLQKCYQGLWALIPQLSSARAAVKGIEATGPPLQGEIWFNQLFLEASDNISQNKGYCLHVINILTLDLIVLWSYVQFPSSALIRAEHGTWTSKNMLSSKDEFIMLTNAVRKLLQLDLIALKSGLGIYIIPCADL